MKSFDVLGCVNDGAAYCSDHCPDPITCEEGHGAIFADSEWDCAEPSCDACFSPIEGVSILHYGNPCEYCNLKTED